MAKQQQNGAEANQMQTQEDMPPAPAPVPAPEPPSSSLASGSNSASKPAGDILTLFKVDESRAADALQLRLMKSLYLNPTARQEDFVEVVRK